MKLSELEMLPVVAVYAAVQFSDAFKLLIAVPLLKSGFWAKNVVRQPENGLPEAKALATYHAASNDEDGIAKAIEQLVLA